MCGGFSSGSLRIYRSRVPVDDVFMESVLKKALHIGKSVKRAKICIVVAEEQFRFAFANKPVLAKRRVVGADAAVIFRA